jgi:hypothetical protein
VRLREANTKRWRKKINISYSLEIPMKIYFRNWSFQDVEQRDSKIDGDH